MKTDRIKTYSGSTVFPFGTPRIITVVWQSAKNYHYEAIALIESFQGFDQVSYHSYAVNKPDAKTAFNFTNDKEGLNVFEEMAFSAAYQRIPGMLYNIAMATKKKVKPSQFDILFKHMPHYDLTLLNFLHNKHTDIFSHIDQNTKSELLKQLVSLAKKMKITHAQK